MAHRPGELVFFQLVTFFAFHIYSEVRPPRTPHRLSREPLRRLASASAQSAMARPRRSLGVGGPFAWLALLRSLASLLAPALPSRSADHPFALRSARAP